MASLQRPRSRGDFKVAIICALKVELDALEAILDDVWRDEAAYGKVPSDTNTYTTGRISNTAVVLVRIPGMGNTISGPVASNCRTSFPNVNLCLLVGICGGVPNDTAGKEILLGDVAISTGVIQYDFGRHYPEGFIIKDGPQESLGRPNPRIRTFLAQMESRENQARLQENSSLFLTRILGKEGFKTCKSPGIAEDRLFKTDYLHKHHESSVTPICTQCQEQQDDVCEGARNKPCYALGCSDDMLVRRDRLQNAAQSAQTSSSTVFHFGLFASANSVMKSSKHRDQIVQERNVIAFEMEGAGVWEIFPTIIVKGVCDYADSHKNKKWQDHAGVVAAAAAKALLREWSAGEGSAGVPIGTGVALRGRSPGIAAYRSLIPRDARQVTLSDSKAWPKIVSGISNHNYEKIHRRFTKMLIPGTGDWFLNHSTIKDWIESRKTSILWFSGSVGSGKTMICTRFIQFLRNRSLETGEPVIYFYCDVSDHNTLRSTYLFASLIKQLLDYMVITKHTCSNDVIESIKNIFARSNLKPDLEDLSNILMDLFQLEEKAWFVIDGLDEFESNESFQVLVHLQEIFKFGSQQKLLVVSKEELGRKVSVPFDFHIQLQPTDVDVDLQSFIDSKMTEKTKLSGPLTDDLKVLQDISLQLYEKACGMFLWTQLQIEALWDCRSNHEIRAALDDLPPDLPTTYERCLKRIPSDSVAIAQRVFRWVICSCRPLHIDELREAVGFDLSRSEWNSEKCPNRKDIKSACANLITEDDDKTIRIVHPSVVQYLCHSSEFTLSQFHIELNQSNLKCGEECINYLSFSDFGLAMRTTSDATISSNIPNQVLSAMPHSRVATSISKIFSSSSTVREKQVSFSVPTMHPLEQPENQKYKLLSYARQYWPLHTKEISTNSPVWNKFEALALRPDDSWKLNPWRSSGQGKVPQLHGLLAYAARERHIPLLRIAIARSVDLRPRSRVKDFVNLPLVQDELPALHAASRLGYADVVSRLLQICDVNALDSESKTALHYAAGKNHLEVAKVLLSVKKVSVTALSRSEETPLSFASALGFEEMVKLLLRTDPAILPKSTVSTNPIIAAATGGHTSVLNSLLFAQVKLARNVGGMALREAAQAGHAATVKSLLSRSNIDINAESIYGSTALIKAASNGHADIVQALVSRSDIDINAKDYNGSTALIETARKSHADVIQALLSRSDLDINAKDYFGYTALIWAAREGYTDIVQALLSRSDLDINAKTTESGGYTALMLAAWKGRTEAVQALLSRSDLDINAKTTESGGYTALMCAAREGHTEAVQALLSRSDIDVEAKDNEGYTALTWATKNKRVEVVKQLS